MAAWTIIFWSTLLVLGSAAAAAAGGGVEAAINGDLVVSPAEGRTVLVQGIDVPAALNAAVQRLRALEYSLRISQAVANVPAGTLQTSPVPRVGQDLLGNILLLPAPSILITKL
jgi:hypothetical protein